jgi:3-methylcrotonyl-CoA carboxylase alpha subunit
VSDGREDATPRIEPLGRGRYAIDEGGHRRVAFAAVDGARTWVFLDGVSYLVDTVGQGRIARHQHDDTLSAPMPATVTQIHVAPGQQVQAGDVLITLEAMKMELPIRAGVDGIVGAVNCRAGEMVQPGTQLVELRTPNSEPRTGNPNPNQEA